MKSTKKHEFGPDDIIISPYSLTGLHDPLQPYCAL
jgi:hypothetical protein